MSERLSQACVDSLNEQSNRFIEKKIWTKHALVRLCAETAILTNRLVNLGEMSPEHQNLFNGDSALQEAEQETPHEEVKTDEPAVKEAIFTHNSWRNAQRRLGGLRDKIVEAATELFGEGHLSLWAKTKIEETVDKYGFGPHEDDHPSCALPIDRRITRNDPKSDSDLKDELDSKVAMVRRARGAVKVLHNRIHIMFKSASLMEHVAEALWGRIQIIDPANYQGVKQLIDVPAHAPGEDAVSMAAISEDVRSRRGKGYLKVDLDEFLERSSKEILMLRLGQARAVVKLYRNFGKAFLNTLQTFVEDGVMQEPDALELRSIMESGFAEVETWPVTIGSPEHRFDNDVLDGSNVVFDVAWLMHDEWDVFDHEDW